jgi:ketosteroid isomerase-like protein
MSETAAGSADRADILGDLIERFNDAWNRQDVDAAMACHTDDVVFHNHTAGERAEGSAAVRAHIAGIFANWPGMVFSSRSLYLRDGLIVQEWTASAPHTRPVSRAGRVAEPTGATITWDGMDIMPTRGGLIARKDVYSDSLSVLRQLGLD